MAKCRDQAPDRIQKVDYFLTQLDDTVVTGAHVAELEFVNALLRHGGCEEISIFATGEPEQLEALAGSFGGKAGVRIAPARSLPRLAAEDPPDVFQIPFLFAAQIAYLRERFSQHAFPITGYVHAIAHGDTKPLLARHLAFESHMLDVAVCPTRHVERALLSICEEVCEEQGLSASAAAAPRTAIIPVGVDMDRFKPAEKAALRQANGIPADAVVIAYVGRLNPWTKADLLPLVVAFARMATGFAVGRVRLLIAGQEQAKHYASLLMTAAQQLGVADLVDIWVDVPTAEIQQVYQLADIFVSPSDNLQETFGMTLVEAMACGLPVVASAWDGYKEIVEEGSTGFLVPTFAAPADPDIVDATFFHGYRSTMAHVSQLTAIDIPILADRMALLVADTARRTEMGRLARQRAEARFGWRTVIDAYKELWIEQRHRAMRHDGVRWKPGPNPYRTDTVRHFRHYPSGSFNDDSAFRLCRGQPAPLSLAALAGVARLAQLEFETAREVLERLASGASVGLGELRPDKSRLATERAAIFLLKHGLIEVAEPVRSSGRRREGIKDELIGK